MQIELEATSYACEATRLRSAVEHYGRSERLRRTAWTAGPLLGGALLSLPVPGWHFIGVPGFLVASVVLGRQRWREACRFEPARGACPACRSQQALEIPRGSVLPATVICPGCGAFVKLSQPD